MAKFAERRGGLKRIVEEKLETPVFFTVLPFLILTAAQMYSGGALDLAVFFGAFYTAFEITRGVAIGFGSETLSVLAGRAWRAWKREAAEIQQRRGMSKVQRTAAIAEAKAQARRQFWFMMIGVGASFSASLSYYIGEGHKMTWQALVNDIFLTLLINAVVLYIGVFRDSKSDDDTDEMLGHVKAGMSVALDGSVARFRDGIASDTDIALIAEHLPEQDRVKFRRAVAKKVDGEMWTTAMLRQALNYGNDATLARKLNNQVRKLSEKPELGLQRGPDGKSWLIPRGVVMDVWGEEIGAAKAMARLLNGRSSTMQPESPGNSPDVIRMFPGRDPGASESVAG